MRSTAPGIYALFLVAAAGLLFPPFSSAVSLSISPHDPFHRYFSGQAVVKTLVVQGMPDSGELNVAWKSQVDAAVLEKGVAPIRRAGAEKGQAQVTLHLPEVQRTASLAWSVELLNGEEVLARNDFYFQVYPKQGGAAAEILRGKKIGLDDPQGRLKDLFNELGVEYDDLRSQLAMAAFRGDAIIIGPRAISRQARVSLGLKRAGGPAPNMLVMDVGAAPVDLLFRLFPASVSIPLGGKIVASGHSLFAYLSDCDFRDWNCPADYSARQAMKKPVWGNYRSLLDTESKPSGAWITEYFLPDRRVIFCQFPLLACLEKEPIAGLLLDNLLRLLIAPLPAPPKTALFLNPGGEAGRFYLDLGLQGALNPPDLDSFDLVALSLDRESKNYLSGRIGDLTGGLNRLLGRGGTAVLLNLEPDTLEMVRSLLLEGLSLKEIAAFGKAEILKRESPLLWGISEEEFSDYLRKNEQSFLSSPLYEIEFLSGSSAIPLVQPPLLWKIPAGKGTIVLCQIPFHRAMEEDKTNALLCQFLTNLGFTLRTSAWVSRNVFN